MVEADKGGSPEFKDVADQVFETLLTITTILSGVYVSVSFGWFGQAFMAPHAGEPMTVEMLGWAVFGIVLGMVFILPLILVLLCWAFAKFRNSAAWGTAAWSGLVYCLTQDFIGVVALFCFSLIATGAIIGLTMIVAGAFVLLIPPILGILIGHKIGVSYSQHGPAAPSGRGHLDRPVVVMIFLILVVQASLVTFIFLGGR